MLRFAMAVLFGGVAVGCVGPVYVALDATTSDAPAPVGVLTLVSPASLTLRPGTTATITVRYTNASGSPVAATTVAVAIEGTALDSTLGSLTVPTDASGVAHVALLAGMQVSHFRVRLSVGSAATYVDVGVGTSFGALAVHAPYTGLRPVVQRVIDVVPGATCAQLQQMPPASGGRTDASLTSDVMISALPATLSYAVLVRARSATTTEAIGCAGPIMPAANATTTVTVMLADVPLAADGHYDVTVAIDAHATIHDAVAAWATSMSAATAARGGDGALLLDGVEAELVRAGAMTASTQLHMARSSGSLDAALETQLEADHAAPTMVIAGMVSDAALALDTPHVELGLSVAAGSPSTLTTLAVSCGDGHGGSVTLVAPTLPARPLVFTPDVAHQAISLDGAQVDAPIGTLALAWLDAVAAERFHATDALTLTHAACASLDTFAASTAGSSALASCDATCRASACSDVLMEMSTMRTSAAAMLDARIATANLSASVMLFDAGDARIDRFSGTFVGSLLDATSTAVGSVSGSMTGTRSVP
jgi:hypothetical protein